LIFKYIWRFFCSTRLAIILVFLLVAFSIIGIIVIQAPADFSYNSPEFLYWLQNVARPQYGFWTDVMAFLQLFSIFKSIWIAIISILLAVNIIVCTINRWRSINKLIFQTATVTDKDLTKGTDEPYVSLKLQSNVGNITGTARDLLKKHGYRLSINQETNKTYIRGIKNNYSPLGTYLSHFSLLLFIIGFLVTSYCGFTDESFIVIEGQQRQVGNGTGLSLYLEDFNDEYWPDGTPKDYRSKVILLDNNVEVVHTDIRVNHPLTYQGIRFHQAFFGNTASINVETMDDETVYRADIALTGTVHTDNYERPQGYFLIESKDYLIYLTAPSTGGTDPFLASNSLGIEIYDLNNGSLIIWDKLNLGEPVELMDLKFTYTESRMFSGFMVSRDPGAGIIWAAAILFLTGICAVFYFPRREAMIYIEQDDISKKESNVKIYPRGKGSLQEIKTIVPKITGVIKPKETKE
jgi:cytochrome c biogenesis protein